MKNKLQFIAARPVNIKDRIKHPGDGASLGAGHDCNTNKFFNLSGSQARQPAPRRFNRVEGIIFAPGRHHNRVTAIQP